MRLQKLCTSATCLCRDTRFKRRDNVSSKESIAVLDEDIVVVVVDGEDDQPCHAVPLQYPVQRLRPEMHIEDDHKMLFNILKMLLLLMIVLLLDGKDDHKLCCTTTTNFSENSRCKSNIQPTLVPCHETDWVTVRHF